MKSCQNVRETCHNELKPSDRWDLCHDCRHFNAILAKNTIAEEIASDDPSMNQIYSALIELERYLGESNQPSVSDILNLPF